MLSGALFLHIKLDFLNFEIVKIICAVFVFLMLTFSHSIDNSESLSSSEKATYNWTWLILLLITLGFAAEESSFGGLGLFLIAMLIYGGDKTKLTRLISLFMSTVFVASILMFGNSVNNTSANLIRNNSKFLSDTDLKLKQEILNNNKALAVLAGICFEKNKTSYGFSCNDSATKAILSKVKPETLDIAVDYENNQLTLNQLFSRNVNGSLSVLAKEVVAGSKSPEDAKKYIESVAPHLKNKYFDAISKEIMAEVANNYPLDSAVKIERIQKIAKLVDSASFAEKTEIKKEFSSKVRSMIDEAKAESLPNILDKLEKSTQ